MRKRSRNWFLRRLVLGFAIVAVAAPVAQARIDEGTLVEKGIALNEKFVQGAANQGLVDRSVALNDQYGQPGLQGLTDRSVALNEKFVPGGPSYSLHPVGAPWSVGTPSQVVQPIHDRPIIESPGAEPVQVVTGRDGFDWGDAGIGAGALFGLMLLAAGALRATRSVGQPTAA